MVLSRNFKVLLYNLSVCKYSRHAQIPEKRVLLLSSSTIPGCSFLEYATKDIQRFLNKKNVRRVLFIPYADVNYNDSYVRTAPIFRNLGFHFESIHMFSNQKATVESAEAVFVGGGNTFLLLNALYHYDLLNVLRERILNGGMPYIGCSAGACVATVNIATTNDMPVVHPPSYEGLNILPFNINPHFYTESEESKHQGETRQDRIYEYLQLYRVPPVLALYDGAILHVEGDTALIGGVNNAVIFEPGLKPRELKIGSNVSDLLKPKRNLCSNVEI